VFVGVFVLTTLAQIVLLVVLDPAKLVSEAYSELYMIIGTFVNSVILVFELFLMRQEILKERPYSPVHRIYWIYLPAITLVRLIIEIVDEKELHIAIYQLVLSAVIFADSLMLCLYSTLLKRQEIHEYEHRELFRFDHLNATLEHHNLSSQLQEFSPERPRGFQLLKLELHGDCTKELRFRVYSEEGVLETKNHVSFDAMADFYIKCCKFDLPNTLNLEQFDHAQLQRFFDDLLADWRCYEPFVLEFLGLAEERRAVYE